MSDIGFVGLGKMGLPIVRRIRSNYQVKMVYDRNASRAETLEGVRIVEEPFHVGSGCNIIFLLLSDDAACESVLFGEKGIMRTARPRSVVVNLSTVSHDFTVSAIRRARESMCAYIEAPVQGDPTMAESGKLMTIASGPEDAFKAISKVIDTYSKRTVYLPSPGAATRMNLIANMLTAVNLAAAGEALLMAEKSGVTREDALQILTQSTSESSVLGKKKDTILSDSFEPEFSLADMVKSLRYSESLSNSLSSPTPLSASASQFYLAAVSIGLGNLDFSSVVRAFRFLVGRS